MSDYRLTKLRESTPDGSLPAHVWPGGYPLFYLTADGLTICPKCANEADTSDPVVDGDVHWEGPPMTCDDGSQCGSMLPAPAGGWAPGTIDSAYGDPDEAAFTRGAS